MTDILGALIPGPAGWAVTAFGSVKRVVGSAVDWITANTTHLLLAALTAVAIWGWLGHHEAAKWHKVADATQAARKADGHTWATVDQINHRSINDLIAVLGNQSAMVRSWADTTKRRQDAAQAALRDATARAGRLDGLAKQIEAGGSGGPQCRTGKAILDARGEL